MTPTDLQQPILLSVLGAGLATAFLHAALPTHWLPFVLVGRAQRWSLAQVMSAVVTAGLAHIVTTAVVGSLIVAAGLALDRWIAGVLPWICRPACCSPSAPSIWCAPSCSRPALAGGPPDGPGRALGLAPRRLLGLVAIMAISPGEVLLPFYLSSGHAGVRDSGGADGGLRHRHGGGAWQLSPPSPAQVIPSCGWNAGPAMKAQPWACR